ncbi:hypothetical protein Q5752_002872 [Cryptotrichosporon argae]
MSAADYFSPVAFFITLRETLEAGIIIAVLLGFTVQIVPATPLAGETALESAAGYETFPPPASVAASLPPNDLRPAHADDEDDHDDDDDEDQAGLDAVHRNGASKGVPDAGDRALVIRRMRWQIWTGALAGLSCAAFLGGIFIWVLITFAHDLWQDAENLWEGCFCALASILILVMGLAFLRLPNARTKWRLKLLASFNSSSPSSPSSSSASKSSRYILFGLPFITVLREGLEGVVFLGGTALSSPPLGLVAGALAGLAVGGALAYTLFASANELGLRRFATLATALLVLVGAGLASRAAYALERQYFINGVGTAAAESGTGPGSFRVAGNIWKLPYGDPEPGNDDTEGWAQIANSLVGWNNVGTFWTVSTYIVYWAAIIVTVVRMKFNEGRTAILGRRSRRGWELEKARRRAAGAAGEGEEEGLLERGAAAAADE